MVRRDSGVPIFGPGDDPHLNAIVHYDGDTQWYQYANGFRGAADNLVGLCTESRAFPNQIVMAICFLYRHSLEIYLKLLFVRANKLLQR